MTIREYINKNLTSLNWNILPQIFESEGVELTEEIERYLRETPKNTNWNVLVNWGIKSEGGSDEPDFLVVQFGVDFNMWDNDSPRVIEIFNYCLRHSIEQDGQIICKALKILYDDGTEVLPLGTVGILKEYSDAERYWDFKSGWITISESGDIGEYEEG